MKRKIAITGATGFLGGRLVDYFFDKGYEIHAFGRKDEFSKSQKAQDKKWDITCCEFETNEIYECVIHCAGAVTDWGGYDEMYKANVIGTKNVLKSFSKSKQFIHISTASVYDPFTNKALCKEDASYGGKYLNHYAKTKMLAEIAVKESLNSNKVIIRPHIIYGPGDTTLLPRLKKARKFGRFIIIGNGKNRLSLTYVDNIAYAIELIMEKALNFEIFNITDERIDTLENILTKFKAVMGYKEKFFHLNKNIALILGTSLENTYRLFHINRAPLITPYVVSQLSVEYTLSIAKAEEMLGYIPKFDYEDGFKNL